MGDANKAPAATLSTEIDDTVGGFFYEFQPSSQPQQNVSLEERHSESEDLAMKLQGNVKVKTENDADQEENHPYEEDKPAQPGQGMKESGSSSGDTDDANEVHEGGMDENPGDQNQNESFEETPYQPEQEPEDNFTNGWEFRTSFGGASAQYGANRREQIRRVRIYVGGPRIYRKLESFIYVQTVFMCLILFVLMTLLLMLGYIAFKIEIDSGLARIGSAIQCFGTEQKRYLMFFVYFIVLVGHAYLFVRVLKNNNRQRM